MKPRTKFLVGGALVIGTAGRYEDAPEKYKDTPGYKRAEQRA